MKRTLVECLESDAKREEEASDMGPPLKRSTVAVADTCDKQSRVDSLLSHLPDYAWWKRSTDINAFLELATDCIAEDVKNGNAECLKALKSVTSHGTWTRISRIKPTRKLLRPNSQPCVELFDLVRTKLTDPLSAAFWVRRCELRSYTYDLGWRVKFLFDYLPLRVVKAIQSHPDFSGDFPTEILCRAVRELPAVKHTLNAYVKQLAETCDTNTMQRMAAAISARDGGVVDDVLQGTCELVLSYMEPHCATDEELETFFVKTRITDKFHYLVDWGSEAPKPLNWISEALTQDLKKRKSLFFLPALLRSHFSAADVMRVVCRWTFWENTFCMGSRAFRRQFLECLLNCSKDNGVPVLQSFGVFARNCPQLDWFAELRAAVGDENRWLQMVCPIALFECPFDLRKSARKRDAADTFKALLPSDSYLQDADFWSNANRWPKDTFRKGIVAHLNSFTEKHQIGMARAIRKLFDKKVFAQIERNLKRQ